MGGSPRPQLAIDLSVSEATVKREVATLVDALGLTCKSDIALAGFRLGLARRCPRRQW